MIDSLARFVRTATRTTRTAVRTLQEDVRTARAKDPAAGSVAEVLTYPGLHAAWLHRVEHRLWEAGFRFTARLSSQVSRFLTGVEIHPAADVGRRVFVDHGMGVVVGETSEIGDDVLLYHGVTLGGGSMRREKRHPTVEDGATIGANATLVGDITIGEGATVGAGSVVVEDVPPGTTVAGNPAAVVDTDGEAVKPYGVETGADRGGQTDAGAGQAGSCDAGSAETGAGDAGSAEDGDSASGDDDGIAGASC